MAYEQQTGRAIDYVLLFGLRNAVTNEYALARIDEQLRENYRLIYVSRPRALLHLYERLPHDPLNAASPGVAHSSVERNLTHSH
jgi:hypothetical protein